MTYRLSALLFSLSSTPPQLGPSHSLSKWSLLGEKEGVLLEGSTTVGPDDAEPSRCLPAAFPVWCRVRSIHSARSCASDSLTLLTLTTYITQQLWTFSTGIECRTPVEHTWLPQLNSISFYTMTRSANVFFFALLGFTRRSSLFFTKLTFCSMHTCTRHTHRHTHTHTHTHTLKFLHDLVTGSFCACLCARA